MKKCFKCGDMKSLDDFYAHPRMADGHVNKCKECNKKDVQDRYRLTRPERAEYERKRFQDPDRKAKVREYVAVRQARNPEKEKARRALGNAIRDGRIIRQPCEACGTTERVQGHHHDYAKPLDVKWLCFAHHQEEHGKQAIVPWPTRGGNP